VYRVLAVTLGQPTNRPRACSRCQMMQTWDVNFMQTQVPRLNLRLTKVSIVLTASEFFGGMLL
jgi:hypothetical protein